MEKRDLQSQVKRENPDPQSLYRFVEARQKARQEHWLKLHQQAVQDAEKILHLIVEKYRPRRGIQCEHLDPAFQELLLSKGRVVYESQP